MTESLKGKVLLAGKFLRDPNFFKTVILVLEHDDTSAMGLVINRPSNVSVAHALAEHFQLPATSDLIYVGGPVEPTALCMLHNKTTPELAPHTLIPGVVIANSAEMFEDIVQQACQPKSPRRYRIFSGYAGWGAEQLEGEIERGDWYIHRACADHLFNHDPYTLYDMLLSNFAQSHTTFEIPREHVEWN